MIVFEVDAIHSEKILIVWDIYHLCREIHTQYRIRLHIETTILSLDICTGEIGIDLI